MSYIYSFLYILFIYKGYRTGYRYGIHEVLYYYIIIIIIIIKYYY